MPSPKAEMVRPTLKLQSPDKPPISPVYPARVGNGSQVGILWPERSSYLSQSFKEIDGLGLFSDEGNS